MKKKINLNERGRNHFAITYVPKQELDLLLQKNLSLIKRYAYIYHDRDFNLDGSPKEPHYHLWVAFNDKKSIKQFIEMFSCVLPNGDKPNTLDEICENNIRSQRYMLHLDNSDKAQYDISEIVYYNIDIEQILDCGKYGISWEVDALGMLVSGVDKFEIAKKYGRDFIYHYLQFRALALDILFDRNNNYRNNKN